MLRWETCQIVSASVFVSESISVFRLLDVCLDVSLIIVSEQDMEYVSKSFCYAIDLCYHVNDRS